MFSSEKITSLWVMPDYDAAYPLWWDGGNLGDRAFLVEELGISPDLLDALDRWQNDWNPPESEEAEPDEEFVRRGRALADRLQAELPDIPVGFDPS